MSPRRWWRRGIGAAVLFLGLDVVFTLAHFDPDPLRLLLLVTVCVALLGLVLDSLADSGPTWQVVATRAVIPVGQDARLSRYIRVLEDHLAARTPDRALRDWLAALADRRLEHRHGLRLTDPGAAELLGPELLRTLTEPPRRLDRAEIERHVRRIEDL